MKYLSIDIETTGLDKDLHQILSVGAILEDTEQKLPLEKIPKFHAAILQREIRGSARALNMNAKLIEWITAYQEAKTEEEKIDVEKRSEMKFYYEEKVVEAFFKFLLECGLGDDSHRIQPTLTSKMKPLSINCAGKNFGTFDKLFLEKLPHWQQAIRIRQRVIDPSILYVDWNKDTEIPGLGKCKERAGFSKVVTHNALEDAWDVIELLRKAY